MTYPSFTTGEVLRAQDMNAVGLWKVNTFTASGSSSELICDNIFNSDYTHYKIVANLNTVGASNWVWMQYLNTTGTAVGSGYYGAFYGQDYATSGSLGQFGVWRSNVLPLGYTYFDTTLQTGFEITIFNPNGVHATTHAGQWVGIEAGVRYAAGTTVGVLNTGAMRGLRFGNNGGTALTGTVRVYGYRN